MGGLEQTRLVPVGSRERALPVTEHLRLEQRLRQSRAVDGNHFPARPAAVGVDELGDDFLAGAALPGDQDRSVRRRHLAGQVHGLPE